MPLCVPIYLHVHLQQQQLCTTTTTTSRIPTTTTTTLSLYYIYIYVYMNNRYINQQQTTIKIDAARRTDHTTQSKPIAKTYLPNYL